MCHSVIRKATTRQYLDNISPERTTGKTKSIATGIVGAVPYLSVAVNFLLGRLLIPGALFLPKVNIHDPSWLRDD